jgi:hypothetical protein
MSARVKNPGLATLLSFIGGLAIIVGGLGVVGGTVDANTIIFAVGASLLSSGLFCLGFAYVIGALAQIISNTDELANVRNNAAQFHKDAIAELVRVNLAIEKLHADNADQTKALQWFIENWPEAIEQRDRLFPQSE